MLLDYSTLQHSTPFETGPEGPELEDQQVEKKSKAAQTRPKKLILELELIQTQMTQKPMLRAEVYARALRASQNRKEDSV